MANKTWLSRVLNIVAICVIFHVAQSALLPEMIKDVEKDSESPRATEWDDPLAYMDEITQLFGERLKEYGFENLPVPDKEYKVNATRYNIHLLGTTQYTNGFVMDILNISRYYRQYIWYFDNSDAVIQYKILMGDVEILYDLDAKLEIANLVGTAGLSFPENLLEVFIKYNRDTMVPTVTSMEVNSVAGPKTNFAPDTDVMRALAYNARLTLAGSLFGDLDTWIEKPFKELLEAIVKEVPFPVK